jgi:hypothetical protein
MGGTMQAQLLPPLPVNVSSRWIFGPKTRVGIMNADSTRTSAPLLQKLHKNEIFRAIQEVGLDPKEFDLEDFDDKARIKHKWSKSYFIVSRELGYYAGQSLVGDGIVWPTNPSSWQILMPRISWWLQQVKQDLDTPDLWAELRHEVEFLGDGFDGVTENIPFTVDEQKQIAARLQEFAKSARDKYSLSEEQMRVLDAKIDYLIKASGRVGRKDWLAVFIGTFLGFMLAAALPPESVHGFLLTSLRAIGLLYPELPLLE